MTTVFDAAGEGSAKACWVLMRRAKRTSLSPQALPRNLRGCSRLPVTAPKNRTRIGPHLGRRKVSLFSPKSGYVRRSEFSGNVRGITRPRIGLRDLAAFEISLPPLAEQRRIVAKLDALLARLRRTRAELDRSP